MAPVFSGSLQPKKKSELQEIAVALRISGHGTKDEIVQRISKHLDANQDSLEENPTFSGLLSRRKRSLQPQPIPSSRLLPSDTGEKPRSSGRRSNVLDPISESTPTKDLQDVSTFLKNPISPIDTRQSETVTPSGHQLATSPTKSLIERLPNVPVDVVVRRIKHYEFVQSGNDLLISLRIFLSNSRNIWSVSVLIELFYILVCIIPWKHFQLPLSKVGMVITIHYPPLLVFQTSAFWVVLLHWALPSLIIPAFIGRLITFNPAFSPMNSYTWASAPVAPLDPLTASIIRLAAQIGYPYPAIASNSGIIGLDVLGSNWRVLSASVGLAFAFAETISAAPQTVVEKMLKEERRPILRHAGHLEGSLATPRRVITASEEQADEVD